MQLACSQHCLLAVPVGGLLLANQHRPRQAQSQVDSTALRHCQHYAVEKQPGLHHEQYLAGPTLFCLASISLLLFAARPLLEPEPGGHEVLADPVALNGPLLTPAAEGEHLHPLATDQYLQQLGQLVFHHQARSGLLHRLN